MSQRKKSLVGDPSCAGSARSIKAVVRVRPLLSRHIADNTGVNSCLYGHPTNANEIVVDQKIASAVDPSVTRDTSFSFDTVLWSFPEEHRRHLHPSDVPRPCAGQEECFAAVGMEAADCVLSGSHACLLAYGQTGSGKSHTVFGPPFNPGIAPRSARHIFSFLEKYKKQHHKFFHFSVEMACFEIYNEKVTDLLATCSRQGTSTKRRSVSPQSTRGGSSETPTDDEPEGCGSNVDSVEPLIRSSSAVSSSITSRRPDGTTPLLDGRDLRVRSGPNGSAIVEGLSHEVLDGPETFAEVMASVLSHRTTAATLLNDTSSRSHAVLQLRVLQEDKVIGRRLEAVLNFVDLAGSERVSRSGAAGSTFNEARHINLSLTALRRVIDVLVEGKKSSHVPTRDSVLTMLLADCFGGNAYTTMIATVSAHSDDSVDTIGTLRYANKASSIVNYVKVNEEAITAVLVAVQQEVNNLRRALVETSEPSRLAATLREKTEGKINRRNSVLKVYEKTTSKKQDRVLNTIAVEVQKQALLAAEAASKVASLQTQAAEINHIDFELKEASASIAAVMEEVTRERVVAEKVQSLIYSELHTIEAMEQSRLVSQKETFLAIRKKIWRRQFIAAAEVERERRQRMQLEEAVRQLRDEHEKLTLLDEASQNDFLDEGNILSAFREHEERCRRIAQTLTDTYASSYSTIKLLRESIGSQQLDIRTTTYSADLLYDQNIAAKAELLAAKTFNAHLLVVSERRLMNAEDELAVLDRELDHAQRSGSSQEEKSPLPAPDEPSSETVELIDALLAHRAAVTKEVDTEAAAVALLNKDVECLSAQRDVVEMSLLSFSGSLLRGEQQARTLKALIAECERVARCWCFPDSQLTCPLSDHHLASLAIAVNSTPKTTNSLECAKRASRSLSPWIAPRSGSTAGRSSLRSEPSPRMPSGNHRLRVGHHLKLEDF
jgi:hypothetical protein